MEKRASSPAPHRGGRRGVACPFARSRKGGGWVVYDCAALGREAGGGGAGEDCCEGFILHRKCGRQPAAENDEQTLRAVLLSMFATGAVYHRLALASRIPLRQCPSYRLSFHRLIVSSSLRRPGKSSLMSVFSWRWSTSSSLVPLFRSLLPSLTRLHTSC